MIRDKLGALADWAHERTLDLNPLSSFGRAGFVMRARFFEPGALDVDMSGKVCLVTGANAGLGFATSRELAERGATVHLLCRNRGRGEQALAELQKTATGPLVLEIVDVSEPASIREFVQSFSRDRVDVLVNNAGVLLDERRENSIGIEMTWATNLVGAYQLTRMLLPRLEAAAGRVVLVSSGGMYLQKLDVDDWQSREGEFDGTRAYANTKRAMVILAEEWAADFANRGVTVNSMHPGWVDTAGVRGSLPRFYRLTRSILRDWDQGADTIVWLAISQAAGPLRGAFVFDREVRRTHVVPWTREPKAARAHLMGLLESSMNSV